MCGKKKVFEHLADPKTSCKNLFDSLLPSGALVFSAPQQSQFHKVPNDIARHSKTLQNIQKPTSNYKNILCIMEKDTTKNIKNVNMCKTT